MTQGRISDLAGVERLHGRLEGRQDAHRLDCVGLFRPERRHLVVQPQHAVDDLNQVHRALVLVVPRVLGDEFNAVLRVQNRVVSTILSLAIDQLSTMRDISTN